MMKIRCSSDVPFEVKLENGTMKFNPGRVYSFSNVVGKYLVRKFPEKLVEVVGIKEQLGATNRMLSSSKSETK